jgi:hypothetical protein
MTRIALSTVIAISLLAAGCDSALGPIPRSVAQYDLMQKSRPGEYPDVVILMHNVLRAGDKDLPPAARVDAIQLVNKIAPNDPRSRGEALEILADPSTPVDLRAATLEIVLTKEEPAWAGPLVVLLPRLKSDDPIRAKITAWMARHPGPLVMTEIIKAWAALPIGDPSETQFMEMVRTAGGQPWETSLLETMNSPDFQAAPWAMQILAARASRASLGERIGSLSAQAPATKALQAFWNKFHYLPATTGDFQVMEAIWTAHADSLDSAAKTFEQWKGQGYEVDIRDFHLLDQLAKDPTRQPMTRGQLFQALRQDMRSVEHIQFHPDGGATPKAVSDDLESNVDRLTMADLWTMHLLHELLIRPRIQMAMCMVQVKDRADTHSAWGGLVFYREGGADAVLYQAPPDSPENDLVYAVSSKALADGRESMCRFIAHFEKEKNSSRAGPTAQELRAAKEDNISGVIFTSISAEMFCAHYCTPSGVVVSLGCYPFLESK